MNPPNEIFFRQSKVLKFIGDFDLPTKTFPHTFYFSNIFFVIKYFFKLHFFASLINHSSPKRAFIYGFLIKLIYTYIYCKPSAPQKCRSCTRILFFIMYQKIYFILKPMFVLFIKIVIIRICIIFHWRYAIIFTLNNMWRISSTS